MRVFVAGATGVIGRHLVPSLVEAGHGASDSMLGIVKKRQMPVIGGGTGIWWLGRLLAGELVVSLMTRAHGSCNEKARRDLGWAPGYASWRDGFPVWVKA